MVFTVKILKDTHGFYDQTPLIEIIVRPEFMCIPDKTRTGGDVSYRCILDDVTGTGQEQGVKLISKEIY